MTYQRPKSNITLTPSEKAELLNAYFEYYRQRAAGHGPGALNSKIPRGAFSELLDEIGSLLLTRSAKLSACPGPVRDFLKAEPLPPKLQQLLPDRFRAFCLALNGLKQWLSAEQAATDRYLLGGTARQQCRKIAKYCVVTGKPLNESETVLHHPLRDGRPPIPVSKAGHAQLEQQDSGSGEDPYRLPLGELKREGNRSWVMLRRGCRLLLREPVRGCTTAVAASSRTFARKAAAKTGLRFQNILGWLDKNGL